MVAAAVATTAGMGSPAWLPSTAISSRTVAAALDAGLRYEVSFEGGSNQTFELGTVMAAPKP